ncbi:MAG: DUF1559 domain-containing protein [Gemmatales bacterium]|nr:DUF1559 domain-containing protein [Gemmatales bacterium]
MSAASEIRQECPHCGGTVVVKNRDLVGKKVTCPKCKKAVLVQDTSPAKTKPTKKKKEVAGPNEEEPKKKKSKDKKGDQQTQVKLLLFVGGGVLAVAAIVFVVLFLMGGSGGEGGQQANNNPPPNNPLPNNPPPGQNKPPDGGPVGKPGQPGGGALGNLEELLNVLQAGDPQKVQGARQELVRRLLQPNPQVRQELIQKLQELAIKLADRDYNPALHVLELASRSLRSTNQEVRRELSEAVSAVRRKLHSRLGNWQTHATNLLPNDTQTFVHIPVARILRGFTHQMLFEQAGFLPQDFERQLGIELSQLEDIVVASLPTRQQCMIIVTTKAPFSRERVEAALRVQKENRQTRAGKEYYFGQVRFLQEFLGTRFPLASLAEKAAVYFDANRKTLVMAHEELLASWLEKPPSLRWRLEGTSSSGANANLPPADFSTFLTLDTEFRLLVDRIDREGPYALLYAEWRSQKQSKEMLEGLKAWLQWLPSQFRVIAQDLALADGMAFALVQLPEAPTAINLALRAPDLAAAERIKNLALRVRLPAIGQALGQALDSNVVVRDLDAENQPVTSGHSGDAGTGAPGGVPGIGPPGGGGSGPAIGGPPAEGGSAPGGGAEAIPGGGTGAAGPGGVRPIQPPNPGPGPGGSAPGGSAPAVNPGGGAGTVTTNNPPQRDNLPRDPNKPDLVIVVQQDNEFVQVIFGMTKPTEPLAAYLEEELVHIRGEIQLRNHPFRIHDLARASQNYPANHSRNFPPGALLAQDESYGMRGNLLLEEHVSFFRELLPYLDDDRYRQLHSQIDPSKPWYEAKNLKAARVLIPHFLHPDAPPFYGTRRVDNREVRLALTHFVGMAGVGPEAPFYRKDHPLAGIFGDPAYRGPTSLDDVRDGTSNTILLIQTDWRLAGPWIQGGGATMRGTSWQGNDVGRPYGFLAPPHGGKQGTFVVMADGSVRYVTRDIAPEVFKALCTMAGGENLPPLDNIASPVPAGGVAAPAKPDDKSKPAGKPAVPISRRDPWSPDNNLLAQLAQETSVGVFVFRPPAGFQKEEGKPSSQGEIAAQWIGPLHSDVGGAPVLIVSLTPLDLRLAGYPLDMVVREIISRFPADGGKWEFDNHIERGLIAGRLFARVGCRFVGRDNQRLEGYYYQHTDGLMGLGILILDHPIHAANTLPLLEASVATFRRP